MQVMTWQRGSRWQGTRTWRRGALCIQQDHRRGAVGIMLQGSLVSNAMTTTTSVAAWQTAYIIHPSRRPGQVLLRRAPVLPLLWVLLLMQLLHRAMLVWPSRARSVLPLLPGTPGGQATPGARHNPTYASTSRPPMTESYHVLSMIG